MRFSIKHLAPASLLPLAVLLSGCSMDFAAPGNSAPVKIGAIAGKAFGGEQPISGGHIYLFAAGTSGYGGSSVSLLNGVAYPGSSPMLPDGKGNYYATSDSGGNFLITGEYTCTPGQQIYLYAVQGNAGAGNNTAIGLMSVLGQCPAAGNLAATVPIVYVSEISTVVAAYAMAGFAVDATHVSDDEGVVGNTTAALARVGMANAFATAGNLKNVAYALAYATTPSGGTAPQATIDTLANILASCVNTSGPTAGGCPTLLADAGPGGATDTATAAINIAHNPGANVAALYNLQTSVSPYPLPELTTVPNDFMLGVIYTPSDLNEAEAVTIDTAGNAWIPNFNGNSLTELSPLGVQLSPASTGFTGGGLHGPDDIAIDLSGNLWISNGNGLSISEFNSSGSPVSASAYPLTGGFTPEEIAIDPSGTPWVTISGNPGTVAHLSSSGAVLATYSGGGYPSAISVDPSGNIWFDGAYGDSKLLYPSYTAASPAPYALGGVNQAIDASGNVWSNIGELSSTGTLVGQYPSSSSTSRYWLALDGAGNVWMPNQDSTNSLQEISNARARLSPTNDFCYGTSLLYTTARPTVTVDGSGNLWLTGQGQPWVTELIGAATPVVTPISLGEKYSKLATRP